MAILTHDNLPHYTYDDYVNWEGKWELVEGLPHAMSPAPSIRHQIISNKIARQLDEKLDHCEACIALLPVDWKVNESTVLQPDNMIICYKPSGAYISKAPSLIFEILSKSTAPKDTYLKFEIYQNEGVRYYVIVNPDDQVAKVYELHQGRYIKKADVTEELVDFDLLKCSINFDFSKIWQT